MNMLYMLSVNQNPDMLPLFDVTFKTAERHVRNGQIVIYDCGAMPKTFRAVTRATIKPMRTVKSVMNSDARAALADMLRQEGDPSDFIICCDCRDMVFQSDPFDAFAPGHTYFLMEGPVHRDCHWNDHDHAAAKPYLPDTNCNPDGLWPVLNGGFIAGHRSVVISFFLRVHEVNSKCAAGSDQSAFNYVANHEFIPSTKSVMVHPINHTLIINGHSYRTFDPKPVWKDGMLHNPVSGKPYPMFHQWDRTEWRDNILAQYGQSN